jgi:hypothetical protein
VTTVALQGSPITLLGMWAEYPSGPAVDVAGLTIQIETADGVTTVLAATSTGVAHPETGVYTYVWAVDAGQAPGGYLVTWAGTVAGDPVTATELVTVAAVPTFAAQLAAARRYDRVPYQATDAAGRPIPGAHGTLWDGVLGGNGASQVTNVTTLDGTPIPGGVLVADTRGYYPGVLDLDKTANLYIIGSDTGVIAGVDPVLIEPSDTDDRVIAIEAYVTGPGGLSDRQDGIDASRGEPGGIATLGADGRVLPSQLPSVLGGSLGFSITDYGALGDGSNDDAAAIQSVLNLVADQAPGAKVIVPPGTYLIGAELEIKSSVHLELAPGATIRRTNNATQYMIKNFNSSYAPTLYGGRGGIRISGGIWDAAGDTLTGSVTAIIVAHAKGVRVDGVTVRNVRDWHAIEINSTQDAIVSGCTCEGFNPVASGRTISEAVQIDLALNSGALPGIGSGAYDNTPCDDVLVTGCTARSFGSLGSFGRLCGSHAFFDSVYHRKVRIIGNHAQALNDYMVRGYNWIDAVVQGNTCTDSNGGVRFEVPTGATVESESIVISGNTFRNLGVQNNGLAVLTAAISIAGLTSPSVPVREAIVTGNILKTWANATGLELVNVADAVVTGNVIKTGTAGSSVGIDVAGSANSTINGNKIDTVATGIKTRDATVAGTGASLVGNHLNICSNTAIQADAAGTTILSNRVKGSGNASKASTEINAGQCLYDCNYVWKTGGAGSVALMLTASSVDALVAACFFRGWGTTQAVNITDNGTASSLSSTVKYISTA